MRITVLGKSPAWQDAGGAGSGYLVQTDEVPAWDALSQGRVDAILEDWGHPDQEQLYVKDKKTIVPGGDLGVTGHIGWYVPKYWADEHPDVVTTSLTMSTQVAGRLAGGRRSPEDLHVVVHGDEDVARRVLQHLAITP